MVLFQIASLTLVRLKELVVVTCFYWFLSNSVYSHLLSLQCYVNLKYLDHLIRSQEHEKVKMCLLSISQCSWISKVKNVFPTMNWLILLCQRDKLYVILNRYLLIPLLPGFCHFKQVLLDKYAESESCECISYWQVDKVVQMYETMLTRHTTMIVGPTGGGKSVVINTLCQSQTKWVVYRSERGQASGFTTHGISTQCCCRNKVHKCHNVGLHVP